MTTKRYALRTQFRLSLKALVDQWIEWSRSKIEPNRWGVIGPIFGWATFDQTVFSFCNNHN